MSAPARAATTAVPLTAPVPTNSGSDSGTSCASSGGASIAGWGGLAHVRGKLLQQPRGVVGDVLVDDQVEVLRLHRPDGGEVAASAQDRMADRAHDGAQR